METVRFFIMLDELEAAVAPQLYPDSNLARQQLAVRRERLAEKLDQGTATAIELNHGRGKAILSGQRILT